MPMMPMDPANAVMRVRPFFVMRLLNDSASAVGNDMLVLRDGLVACGHVRRQAGVEGVGVASDDAVGQVHDAGGVLLGQLGVVRDHDDEAVVGDLGEQVHDLDARLGVEGAGGLVGQKDLRVVDEGAGDGHALHLAAGELAGLFVHVLAEAHALERLAWRARAARRATRRIA